MDRMRLAQNFRIEFSKWICNSFAVAVVPKSCYNIAEMSEKVVATGGKPFRSKLAPYESEVTELGFPPIVVLSGVRLDYIRELWDYKRAVGVISLAKMELLPEPSCLDNLRRHIRGWWQTTLDLVAEANGTAAK